VLKPPVADAVKTAEADQVTLVVSTADAVIVTALPAGKPWPANVTAVSHGACAGTERVGDPVADVPTADAAVPLWVPPRPYPSPNECWYWYWCTRRGSGQSRRRRGVGSDAPAHPAPSIPGGASSGAPAPLPGISTGASTRSNTAASRSAGSGRTPWHSI